MEEKNIKEPTPEGEKLKAVELAEDELSYVVESVFEDAGDRESVPFLKRLLKKLVDEEEYKEYLSCGRFGEDEEESEILA